MSSFKKHFQKVSNNFKNFLKTDVETHHLPKTFKYITLSLSLLLFFLTCFALILPANPDKGWSGMFIRHQHKLNALGIVTVVLLVVLIISYGLHIYFWRKYLKGNRFNNILLISVLITIVTWILMVGGTDPGLTDKQDGYMSINLFMHYHTNDPAMRIKYSIEGALMVGWVCILMLVQVSITFYDYYIHHKKTTK